MLNEEIAWLKAGAKVISPSGDDVTPMRLTKLDARLEGANSVLKELEDAKRP
jgi:hypothetical protein